LIRTTGSVIFFYLFRTDFYLAFKFHGGYEEIEKGRQEAVDLGKAGLEGCPLKTVIADVLTDNGAVFLFDETVVVFPMVS
jgi:hypothetical protein